MLVLERLLILTSSCRPKIVALVIESVTVSVVNFRDPRQQKMVQVEFFLKSVCVSRGTSSHAKVTSVFICAPFESVHRFKILVVHQSDETLR